MYDLTNKYVVKVNVITVWDGKDPLASHQITKMVVVDRETTMREFYHEMASLPLLMKGRSLDRTYSSIVFAIRENRFDM